MRKNTYKTVWSTYTLVMLGVLVAMTIVLSRFFAIYLGFARFTLGSVCTIMAGLWFGPLAGALSGMVADLLGTILQGFAVNPIITVGAMVWGVIPALMKPLMGNGKVRKIAVLSVSIALSALISTLGFTLAGLVLINGYNFYSIFPTRVAQFASMTPVYCVLCCCLYFSPVTSVVSGAIQKQESRKAAKMSTR